MQRVKVGISLIFSLALSSQVSAANLDGKSKLICAAKSVVACVYGESCLEGTTESFDLPDFMLVNFEKKQIHANKESGITDVSAFNHLEKTDEQLIIQGVENHRGWTAAIDRKSGHLSISSTGAEVSYMLFGRCTKI